MLSALKKLSGFKAPSIRLAEQLPVYHSRFGGVWTDRLDADQVLAQKLASGAINAAMAEKIRFWMKNGYVILENAVPHAVVDQVNADIEAAWNTKDARFKIQTGHGAYIPLADADRSMPLVKLLDLYAYSQAAQQMMYADAIRDFLNVIFEQDVLAFQNLTFEMGSTQAIHQDTAYVVCKEPMKLAASWIALEDIVEGSGELQYYPGSHRFPDYNFGDPNRKHWHDEVDGKPSHDAFLKHLHERAKEMGLSLELFRPKKGDALIWSADLAHGGGPITKENQSRKSYVTHYCPNSIDPHYFSYLPNHKNKVEVTDGCYFSSSHYVI